MLPAYKTYAFSIFVLFFAAIGLSAATDWETTDYSIFAQRLSTFINEGTDIPVKYNYTQLPENVIIQYAHLYIKQLFYNEEQKCIVNIFDFKDSVQKLQDYKQPTQEQIKEYIKSGGKFYKVSGISKKVVTERGKKRWAPCRNCNGNGRIVKLTFDGKTTITCPSCNGKGEIANGKTSDKKKSVFDHLDFNVYSSASLFDSESHNKRMLDMLFPKPQPMTNRPSRMTTRVSRNNSENQGELEQSTDEMEQSTDEMEQSTDEMEQSTDEMEQSTDEILIDNGPTQYVKEDMGFEELSRALCIFRLCSCDDIRKKYSKFFENARFTFDGLYIPPNSKADELSYKERKRILLQNHKDVIDYIKRIYKTPIKGLERKYLSGVNKERLNFKYGLPCQWHTTVLAQRRSTLAQLSLGVRILDAERYHIPKIYTFFNLYIDKESLKNFFDEESFDQDMKWLIIAGESGETVAYHILGRASKEAQAWDTAVTWFRKGADEGNLSCKFEMGEIARTKLQDYSNALKWYEDAASLGHYKATEYCAELFSIDTKNSKKDYKKAIFYYQELIKMEQHDQNYGYQYRIDDYNKKIKSIQLKMDE